MIKKRNILVAVLSNLIIPGLGFLYLGKVILAIGLPLSLVLLPGISSWTKVIFNPLGFTFVVLISVVIWVTSAILAGIMAYRKGEVQLTKIQKWYTYAGFIIISFIISNMVLDNRGNLFGYETFRFPSRSMANTLMHGDFIISDTWKFKGDEPRRGDLIVFLYPREPTIKYIKRVIGLPNDVVRISNGIVLVNDKELDEPYVEAQNNRGLIPFRVPGEYVVPSNSYFVMGDNRDNSNDSRFWGFVPENNIHGSVEFIWLSYDPVEGFRNERMGKIVN